MKRTFRITIWIFFLAVYLTSCNQPSQETSVVHIDTQNNFQVIADTIITDVVIKNPDQDDEWTDYCLRNLNKEELVNELFDLVYKGKLTPYDFFSEDSITIDDVKQIENNEDYSRDKIGKVQFEEAWCFDSKSQKMVKKVQSIMIAYELYDANDKVKGYKPVFKVYLNE